MQYGKKFLIVGSQNAVTYKEIFPLTSVPRLSRINSIGYPAGDSV